MLIKILFSSNLSSFSTITIDVKNKRAIDYFLYQPVCEIPAEKPEIILFVHYSYKDCNATTGIILLVPSSLSSAID